MNLGCGQPHRIEVGAVRGARGPFRHMTARQPALDVRLGVHRDPVASSLLLNAGTDQKVPGRCERWLFSLMNILSWRGVAKKRRKRWRAAFRVKCSGTVAATQHSCP